VQSPSAHHRRIIGDDDSDHDAGATLPLLWLSPDNFCITEHQAGNELVISRSRAAGIPASYLRGNRSGREAVFVPWMGWLIAAAALASQSTSR
jgi:hypothetical protein